MADPHESPEDETPAERRERLMNLTNPAWAPEPTEDESPEAEASVEGLAAEPTPGPTLAAPRSSRSGKDK